MSHFVILANPSLICIDEPIQATVIYVEEISLKTFMDNCSDDDEFTCCQTDKTNSFQEAVTAAMQEECICLTENRKIRGTTQPSTYL